MATCINCNSDVLTPFCGNCGQPNPPKKLSFGNMWYDFQSRIYGFDGMFPRTLRDLTIRPGFVARQYIKGDRVKYYGAVGYFFLMVTVFLLILSLLGVDFVEFMKSPSNELGNSPTNKAAQEVQRRVMSLMNDNMRTFSFMIVIPIALTARLFFKKAGYNILEHAVLPFYVFGHTYWLTILSVFFFSVFGVNPYMVGQLIISILFFSFACSNFYTHNSKIKAFFKGMAVYLIGYFVLILIMGVFAYVYIFSDPEIREMIKAEKKQELIKNEKK